MNPNVNLHVNANLDKGEARERNAKPRMNNKSNNKKKVNKLAVLLLFFYLYALVKIILFKLGPIEVDDLLSRLRTVAERPELIKMGLEFGNLIPFNEINRAVTYKSGMGFLNLWGNIALFLPFGILLPLASRKKTAWTGMILKAFVLSLALESLQLVLSIGTFDVDDLILNTLGGFLGYLLYVLFSLFGFSQGSAKSAKGSH